MLYTYFSHKKLIFIALIFVHFGVFSQKVKEVQKLVSPYRSNGDYYGYAVAIDGNYAIVGSWPDDEDENGTNTLNDAGAAYIYERQTNGEWLLKQKIVASDRSKDDHFGFSVAISGNTILVGAYQNDTDSLELNFLTNSGAAYIFEKDSADVWKQFKKVTPKIRSSGGWFGRAVAIHNNYAVIGAPHTNSAYFFERNSLGNWLENNKINGNSSQYFGWSVSIYGENAIVGTPDGNTNSTGEVAVCVRNPSNNTWFLDQTIYAPPADVEGLSYFGNSVSIYGNTLLVGAPFKDENYFDVGAIYIYEKNSNNVWVNKDKKISPHKKAYDYFGWAVSLNGTNALITAPNDDIDFFNQNSLNKAGAAFLYELDTLSNNWFLRQKISASDRRSGDEFGKSVAVSGDYIIIGSHLNDRDEEDLNHVYNAGAAYIFEPCNFSQSNINMAVCDSYPSSNGNTYTENGVVVEFFNNASGCDSLVYINLEVLNSNSKKVDTASCDFFVGRNGKIYKKNRTIYDTLTNVLGCDSVVRIKLSITQSDSSLFFPTDTLLCDGDEILLSSEVDNAFYLWQDSTLEQTFLVSEEGVYAVKTIYGACMRDDTINIKYRDCRVMLELPNVFSPNNDGANDFFIPVLINAITEMQTNIYNRWGKNIFSTDDLMINWDAANVSDGLYYWNITYKDISNKYSTLKGWVEVIR